MLAFRIASQLHPLLGLSLTWTGVSPKHIQHPTYFFSSHTVWSVLPYPPPITHPPLHPSYTLPSLHHTPSSPLITHPSITHPLLLSYSHTTPTYIISHSKSKCQGYMLTKRWTELDTCPPTRDHPRISSHAYHERSQNSNPRENTHLHGNWC